MTISVQRDVLAGMLRGYGEDELAGRAAALSDDQLARIGRLGAYYAWSEDAMALGFGMGGARALSLATIDVLEHTGRDLHRHVTDGELANGSPPQPTESERTAEQVLRRRAAENPDLASGRG